MVRVLFLLIWFFSSLSAHDRELNPHGSIFYAVRTPDTYIENVGPVATYQFIARKFKPDSSYIFGWQSINGEFTPLFRFEVDDDGQLGRQSDAGTLMLDNERQLMFDFCKGEPVDYWLCALDGTVRIKTTFVPYPISEQGKDGASITIRRLTPDAKLVLVEGWDFDPDEKIYISTQSGGKDTKNVPFECVMGKFSMIIEPGAVGKSGGTGYVNVTRRSERLILEYDWGSEALNPKKRMANTQRIKQDALMNLPTELN